MIVRGYGIELERLKEKHLELVRTHRNSLRIQQFMHYRENITPEMQMKWFNSINNIHNLYYILRFQNKPVGLINGAQIDWEKKQTGSGGIFVWEENLWHTEVPLLANILMLDFSVLLGLQHSYIKVLPHNKRAVAYNKQLGYTLLPNQENESNQAYVLSTDAYLERTKHLHTYIHKQHGNVVDIVVDDPEHEVTQFLLEKLQKASKESTIQLNYIYL